MTPVAQGWRPGSDEQPQTMDFTNSTIIDANGQLYRVGWDEHGWFTIQPVVELEDEPGEYIPDPAFEYPNHSFEPGDADELSRLIDEGP